MLEQEQGNQGCPNLNAERIFARSHKGLDLEVLLDGLEEHLDFPAVLVDRGDGGGTELQVVGQEDQRPLVGRIPNHHPPERGRASLLGFHAGQTDDVIGQDVAVPGQVSFHDHFVQGVVFHACDEEDAGRCPGAKEGVVVVCLVKSDNGAPGEVEQVSRGSVMLPGFGDMDVSRHVVVMVQEDMHLDAAFGAPEIGPRKQAQAERDGR